MLSRRKFIVGIGAGSLMLASPAVARTRLELGMVRPRSNEQYFCKFGYKGIKKKDYQAFNWLLRDLRAGEQITIDEELLEIAARVQSHFKADALTIKSAYRTPRTNASIRGAARRSLHMKGKAIDISIADVPTAKIVSSARQLGAGGIGWYPRRGFVHLDTGPARNWRR